jgi:hypothetical protein
MPQPKRELSPHDGKSGTLSPITRYPIRPKYYFKLGFVAYNFYRPVHRLFALIKNRRGLSSYCALLLEQKKVLQGQSRKKSYKEDKKNYT